MLVAAWSVAQEGQRDAEAVRAAVSDGVDHPGDPACRAAPMIPSRLSTSDSQRLGYEVHVCPLETERFTLTQPEGERDSPSCTFYGPPKTPTHHPETRTFPFLPMYGQWYQPSTR
jgi:hypothetical protein